MARNKALAIALILFFIVAAGLTVGIAVGALSSIHKAKERVAARDRQIVLMRERLAHTETVLAMEREKKRKLRESFRKTAGEATKIDKNNRTMPQ